ncbi:hypothetical protein VTN00DRAFT_2335 [Thermoascus crustaceus]|uniref:uncharacterized protein n=1 Tax=Thermoascus crustaceus TaxID=5088 RepID=UPI0037420B8D
MEIHHDYDRNHTSKGTPRSLITDPFKIPTIVSPRVQLVNGIIDRAEKYRLILVRGTPACGKTTVMNLVANELLARHSGETPVHIITGWDEKQVEKAGDAVGPPSLSKDLMDELFLISNGHVGCLTALMGVVGRAAEQEHQRRHNPQFELETVRENLFNHPGKLFRYLKDTPFTRGMPKADILQLQSVVTVFKRAVACDEVGADILRRLRKLRP